jgi:protein-L-isoaspartate O-methyltransferase
MKDNELFDFLVSEAEHPFSGWDFSYINSRLVEAPLTWSYSSKILPLIRTSESLLDMGTGGGELLATLSPLPKHTCATEGYKPNVSIAKSKLDPLGVKVVYSKNDENLSFNTEEFELIINRHDYYS